MINKRKISREDTSLFLHSVDVDDEEEIILVDLENTERFDKYINKNKLLVYILLKLANPLTNIILLEHNPEIVYGYNTKITASFSNSICIFYNINTNKVKYVKYKKKY